MPKRASTEDVRRLSDDGAQLVEVLPPSAYQEEHLPGAVNVPMPELGADAVADLDPTRPTVVYCYDHECDLSARGARRLETLGFTDVYDYVASKVAWMASGLPVEGSTPVSSRAGALAREVPTCRFTDRVSDLDGVFDDGERQCVVVDDDRIVLGLVRPEVQQLPAATPVSDVMQAGAADGPAVDHRGGAGAEHGQGPPHLRVGVVARRHAARDHPAGRPVWAALTRSGHPIASSSATGSRVRNTRRTRWSTTRSARNKRVSAPR